MRGRGERKKGGGEECESNRVMPLITLWWHSGFSLVVFWRHLKTSTAAYPGHAERTGPHTKAFGALVPRLLHRHQSPGGGGGGAPPVPGCGVPRPSLFQWASGQQLVGGGVLPKGSHLLPPSPRIAGPPLALDCRVWFIPKCVCQPQIRGYDVHHHPQSHGRLQPASVRSLAQDCAFP